MSITLPGTGFARLHGEILHEQDPFRRAISAACNRSEQEAVHELLQQHASTEEEGAEIEKLARRLVNVVRAERTRASGVDALMHEFSLSSEEGIALMCLAEALLRIPDARTANRLIADKISRGDWRKHLGESPSLFVNAATWGLLITGKLVSTNSENELSNALSRLLLRGGEPVIRKAVDLAMRMLGKQFVTGQTISEALGNSRDNEARGYRYSYDMLGEAALTQADAMRYYAAYENAIHAIGEAAGKRGIVDGPGISVKLSALHPRYSRAQRSRVMRELLPRLKSLLLLTKHYDIGLNIDAEEADRLELSLDLIEALAFDPDLHSYDGLGIVVQAYQKRCPAVIDYLLDLARRSGRRFMIRLVKGAYWDAEIKRAQVAGLDDYPVYTRKVHTDLSYLVCAKKLLNATDVIYPQFATHNAQTLATIDVWARTLGISAFEFQCLHGMGETLYDHVVGPTKLDRPCRIYAPVGSHQTLLAYLVRRLLENGANTSFVHRVVDDVITIDSIVRDPFSETRQNGGTPHPNIALPAALFGAARKNSAGIDFSNEQALRRLSSGIMPFASTQWLAGPLIDGIVTAGAHRPICNPADHVDIVGFVADAKTDDIETALTRAEKFSIDWQTTPVADRAAILRRSADLLEAHRDELMVLACREAGKTLPDALAEVREAVDFLRYYAEQAGDSVNSLALGTVVCISPWNFPLAIFIGQLSAALVSGNVVLAKPAEQTSLIAYRAVQLLHEAGIPRHALQFLPGDGEKIGAKLVADRRIHGVMFTGSTEVARHINRTLARRSLEEGCDLPLIAETGGQNAMIIDSSALTEQVVQDALFSAFNSAGQRCSALRVLCLQEEIADKTMTMLLDAMQELVIGHPASLACDVGPVIDMQAQAQLLAHIERMRSEGRKVYQCMLHADTHNGSFVPPTVIEIASLEEIPTEVFGPVLHVLRYCPDGLHELIESINATGYGLTLGIHTRIDETVDLITARARVGNIYVNRNMVGAIVGSQPFGGEGLSGTGPKAGGPLYLLRLQRQPRLMPGEHTITMKQKANPEAHTQQLHQLLDWLHRQQHHDIAVFAEQYRHQSLLNVSEVLPGPTGETNTLTFVPRGHVLCAAMTLPGLLNQLAAVLATGNKPLIFTDPASRLPAVFLHDLFAPTCFINMEALHVIPCNFALIEASDLLDLRLLLAERAGAVVPVLETGSERPIPVWRLVCEHAICINTTAAGGNASLMAMQA